MKECNLDEFGILQKTENEPEEGIKRADKILNKFSDDYGPVAEYGTLLKNEGSSESYDTFRKDFEWLKEYIEKIADYMYKEQGMQKICMSAYFIEMKLEDHDCVQIQFPCENTILKYHRHGPNFAQYLTTTIGKDFKTYSQADLVDNCMTQLMESIPEHQLKHMNWIEPKYISNYALDADPHFIMQMEFDLESIKRENSGVYADLFIEKKEKFPFFPFQPVFAGKDKEVAVIILPTEELFDIKDFRDKICERTGINSNDVNVNKRYNYKIDTEELKYSTAFRTAHEIRVKYRNPTDISDYIEDFVHMTHQGLRAAQKCGTSDYLKGKTRGDIENGLIKRILKSYECPTFVNLDQATFGPPDERTFIDPALTSKMHRKFKEYKKKRLNL